MGLRELLNNYNPKERVFETEKGLLKEFGERLRSFRESKGLTQEKMGERAGVSYKYLGEVERGEKNPSLMILLKIAAAFEVHPAVLLCCSQGDCRNCHDPESYITAINGILVNKDITTLCKVLKVLKVIFGEDRPR